MSFNIVAKKQQIKQKKKKENNYYEKIKLRERERIYTI